jgi:hypothetical protein
MVRDSFVSRDRYFKGTNPNSTKQLRPFLCAMQYAADLNNFGANTVNREEGQTAKEQFTRSGLASKTATVRKSGKRLDTFYDSNRYPAAALAPSCCSM